mgnify:CR=1 FL=1
MAEGKTNGVKQQRADVLVIGGGTSGCVAAIAAARNRADALLVERYGFLGSTATAVFMPMMSGGYERMQGFARLWQGAASR